MRRRKAAVSAANLARARHVQGISGVDGLRLGDAETAPDQAPRMNDCADLNLT